MLGSVNTTLHEDKGMVLQQIGFKKALQVTKHGPICIPQGQAVQYYLFSLHQRPPNHKGLAVSASSHITRAGEGRLTSEVHNYADLTATGAPAGTGVMSLSCEGLASEGNFTGPVSGRDLLSSVCVMETHFL